MRGVVVAAEKRDQIGAILVAQRGDVLQRRGNGYGAAAFIDAGDVIQCTLVGSVVRVIDLGRLDQANLLVDAAARVRRVGHVDKVLDARQCLTLATHRTDVARGVDNHHVNGDGTTRSRLHGCGISHARRRRGQRDPLRIHLGWNHVVACAAHAQRLGRLRHGRGGSLHHMGPRGIRHDPQRIPGCLRDQAEHALVRTERQHHGLRAVHRLDGADPSPSAIGMQDVALVFSVDASAGGVGQPHAALEHRIECIVFADLDGPGFLGTLREHFGLAGSHGKQGRG